jgi:NodT family efflux transporter outer membrane factor (OMF) lipoprotein
VSWEADVWGRIRRTVEASRSSAQASAADLESVRLSVQAALAQAYFQLQTVDAQMQLLNATAAAYKKALELTQNRYDSGVAGKTDVLQAETQLKSTQAQLIDLGVQRAQLEHAIAVLIGKPAPVFSLAAMPLAATPPAVPVGVPSELLERRPDIASAERRIAAANAQIGVAKAAFFPRVTLSASGGYESSDSSTWLTWPSHFWSLGPALVQPLFAGGSIRALSDQARAAYDGTVATYRQTVLTGFQEVEDNLAASRILEEEAQVQGAAVKSAQQSLALIMNQYKAETVNYLNVIIAQTTALTNERVAADIAGRRMAAAVLLIKALGGGWEAASSLQTTP